jgi:hypothetical protein
MMVAPVSAAFAFTAIRRALSRVHRLVADRPAATLSP